MSVLFDQVKVLEQYEISPPPNSAPTATFPITFFDVPWLLCCPVQRVFFYQVSFSAAQFTEEVVPQLKNSLSLALQRFFPLCGNSVCPPQPSEPYILYKEGDSVPLLIAQSTGAFSDFLRDGPKDAIEIHPLVPPTPPTHVLADTPVEITPLLAVQITLFPNSGLSIGINYRHIVADGMSSIHFVKTWASIFKANCDMSIVPVSLPILDKGVIKDPDGIKDVILNQWRTWGSPTWNVSKTPALVEDNVRATFTLSRVEIDRLKIWVSTKCDNGTNTAPNVHFSSYVVTSAYIWVCLMKSLDAIKADDSSKDDELCHFFVLADCRKKYGLGIPVTFFGNCLSARLVSVARSKFRLEDCVATVAETIHHSVQGLKCEVLDGYKNILPKWANVAESGENLLTVAGSPNLAAYETDFGWGTPKKIEVVHIDISGAISLSESRIEHGGIEVGICLSRHQMEVFTSLFQAGMNQFL